MSLLLWGRVRLLLLIWTLSESVLRNVLAGSICTTGQCSGVTAWHGPQTEHDLGWRSAADADHLCHWGGFQGSAMAAALTSLGRHAHTHMHELYTHCEASVPAWPTLIILSLSNRWWASPDVICVVGLCSETAFRTQGELAGNMPDLQVSCPITDIK